MVKVEIKKTLNIKIFLEGLKESKDEPEFKAVYKIICDELDEEILKTFSKKGREMKVKR